MNEFLELSDRWNGLLLIFFGIYAALLAHGVLPKRPKDPERLAIWRKKFGGMMRILSPLLILFGLFNLVNDLTGSHPNPAIKRVLSEFRIANEAREARGRSLPSVEQYLADLKRIDLGEVPADIRSAAQDYIRALEDGLALLKAGRPSATADERMAAAMQRLQKIQAANSP